MMTNGPTRAGSNSTLKAVNHPANSGGLQQLKLNYNFDIFCFDFGAAVAKIFNKYKKIFPEKSFWKLCVLFFPLKPQ